VCHSGFEKLYSACRQSTKVHFYSKCHTRNGGIGLFGFNKKLNCRKHIMCQLYTQYVEGIYSKSMTLKSRLGVTEGCWK